MLLNLRAALVAVIGIVLAACGGGGGGGGTSISVSPSSLSFKGSPSSNAQTQNVHVTFDGAGVIVGIPPGMPYPGWLDAQQLGGNATSVDFAVNVYPYGMPAGTYTTTLRFVTANVDSNGNVSDVKYKDVPVTMTVIELALAPQAVSREAVDGANTTLTGAFDLAVAGGRAWTATDSQPWLTVEPSGTGPGSLDYTVDPSGLAPGNHTATVTVTADGVTATASLTVTVRAPRLVANPAAPSFTVATDNASATLSQTLRVTDELDGANASAGLSWSLQSISAPWLKMAPTSGSSAPGVDATLSLVESQMATMPNGTYTANVVLSSTDSAGTVRTLVVPVTLNLNSPLTSISLAPDTALRVVSQLPVQFTATGTYASGYSGNVTSQVNWSSSSAAVEIGNGGTLAKGLGEPRSPGIATITATMPGTNLSDAATFTVTAPLGYAYYSSYYSSELFQFIFGDDGELSPLRGHASVPTQGSVRRTLISPSGKYAYLVMTGSGTLRQYTMNAGGYLEPMATVVVPNSENTGMVAIDPTEQNLYAAAYDAATSQYVVRHYRIGDDGSLTLVSATTPGVGDTAWEIQVRPTGGALYIAEDSTLTAYSIAADGSLTKLPGTYGLRHDFALHPSGNALYAITQYDVRQYTINADGTLTAMSPASVPIGSNPIGEHVAVDATGAHLYAIDSYQGKIRHFKIGADLKLTVSGADASNVPYTPRDLALEPSGKYLYVTGNGGEVAKYTLDANGDFAGVPTVVSAPIHPFGFVVRAGE